MLTLARSEPQPVDRFPEVFIIPLTYPDDFVLLSNGLGFSTTANQLWVFQLVALGPDNRILWYLGDTWKRVKSNVGPHLWYPL